MLFIWLFLVLHYSIEVEAWMPNVSERFKVWGLETTFPGPWEAYNKAPSGRTIRPVKVYNVEGTLVNPEGLSGGGGGGGSTTFTTGSLVTYEFKDQVAGRVYWSVSDDSVINGNYNISFGLTESPNFIGRHCDSTRDLEFDDALQVPITKGNSSFGELYIRGAFKYLTVFIDGTTPSSNVTPKVTLTDLYVEYAAMPHFANPQAYTGYFYSSDNLLNRIWYAGAYTLQITSIDPKQGGSLLSYNRRLDHNTASPGQWFSNFTIANGTSVTTDGAKRDRMVYAGDMSIAVPGIAVSTYDLNSIQNALETLFAHQYGNNELPYAGPPMGFTNEFSDTYHLHALLGVYNFVHYSGDRMWLQEYWPKHKAALEYSISKVNSTTGLFYATSANDWLRPGMGGFNSEANAIFYEAVSRSIELATFMDTSYTSDEELQRWRNIVDGVRKGMDMLWDETRGMYRDNPTDRSTIYPQDGNSWVLITNSLVNITRAKRISNELKKRWGKYGAPAVEMSNVISPFATGFELQAHCQAGNHQDALDLIRLMWGYMLDGPGMTNSTLLEGYTVDGNIRYPAYGYSSRNSHAHGWSTAPTYVLSTQILGIQLLTPLGQTWRIQPQFADLTSVQGGYSTDLGQFVVKWEKGGNLTVETPSGTEGDILWQGKKYHVGGGGVFTVNADASAISGMTGMEVVLETRGEEDGQRVLRESWENQRKRLAGRKKARSRQRSV